MRRPYFVLVVGLWTILLCGLLAWNLYGMAWLSDGAGDFGQHEFTDALSYMVVWVLGSTGIMVAYRWRRWEEKEQAQLVAAIVASEERWRSALEAVGDGVWDWNAATDAVYFSPRWKSMLGYADDELDNRFAEWQSRVHPDDHARTMAAVQAMRSGETPVYDCEHRLQCKDGSYKWILARGQIVSRSPDGKPLRIVGTHRDLSAQKQAEAARLESEARYRHLLGSVTDYVFTVALVDGRPQTTTHSPGCLAVTGYTPEEYAANPLLWIEMVPATEEAAVVAHSTAALRGELGEALEHQIRHKDGSTRWVSSTLVPRRDAIGALVACDGLVQDITARKQMESDLRESEARYRLIADNTGDVIWLFDLATKRFSFVSPSVVRLSGFTVDESLRLGLQDSTPAESYPQAAARLAARIEALAAGDESVRTRTYEFPLSRKDGTIVDTEVVTTLVTDAGGRVTHLQGVSRDVTVRKQAEEELRRVSHWLEHTQRISRVGGWALNLSTSELWSSSEARRIYGFGEGKFSRADILEIPLPEYRPVLDRAMRDLVERGVPYDLEFKIRRRDDGAVIDIHSRAERGPDGVTVIGVIQDITERKQIEMALRESEGRLAATLGAINDLIFVLDRDGRFVGAHCPPEVPLLVPREELYGREYAEILPPAVSALLGNALGAMAGTGEVQRFDYELLFNGETSWWSAAVTQRSDSCGVAAGAVLVCREITDRKRAEAAVRESRETYLGLFNTVSEAIYVHGVDGVFLDVNEGTLRMYGYSREEMIGRTPADVAAAGRNDLGAVGRKLAEVFATGRPAAFEFWACRKNGEEFPKACVTSRGKYFGKDVLITTARDMTLRLREEEALARSEARFRTLFQFSPFGAFEEDFSAVKARFDELRRGGETDIGAYLAAHPEEVVAMSGLVGIVTMNEGGARLLGLASADPATVKLPPLLSAEAKEVFAAEIAALAEGRTYFRSEFSGVDIAGRPLSLDMTLTVQPGHEAALDRVIVSFIDISQRTQTEARLRESEERYRNLVELSPEAVIVQKQGRIIFTNRAALQLIGATTPEQIIGREIMDIVHPDSRALVAQRASGLAVEGQIMPMVRQKGLRLDGTVIEVSVMSTRVNFDGEPAIMIIAVDMTNQRLAEAELRKLSRAVEQSPVTVVITDAEGTIEYVNPSFTLKSGYTFEEVRGKTSRILGSGEASADAYRELWATITAGREWRGEFHNRKKNGELFWEAATISPIFDDTGKITHFLAVKEDISERKLAENRIREQAALLDVTQDAILVLSLDRVVTFWNRGAEKLYGVGREQALGRRYDALAYRELPGNYDADWREFLVRGEWTVERRQVARERGDITVQKRATLVRDEQGQARSVLIVVTDITEAKRLEGQFLRAQRLEGLGSLASGVAHDLNNVLTPILMSTGMLAETARTKQERELVQLLADSAQRGADIVQQLLIFGRGSDSPRSPMSVATVIKDMEQMIHGTFPKRIVLTVHVPKNLWMIDGDRTQVHQVMLNLCVNARDAMPTGGKLSLVAENVQVDASFAAHQPGAKPGPHIVLRVKDTGTGIASEVLEKIFDPFFTTKPTGQGTGLGLATVLGIVRSHGGFVTVESQPGIGSEFAIYLPARTVAVELTTAERNRPKYQGHGELILVIDDEASIRSALGRVLVAHNYEVLVAGDGVAGIAVFVQHAKKIKLVISDIMMPVMDGAQAIRALRRLNPELPVIAISGVPTQRVELEANFGPHIRFLPKPFLVEKALSLARELLDDLAPPTGAADRPARK